MSTSLRRKLTALRSLTEDRGATPGEAAAALAAIERIRSRLNAACEAVEWQGQTETYQEPAQPRAGQGRKASHERPKQNRMKIGDLIDCRRHVRPVPMRIINDAGLPWNRRPGGGYAVLPRMQTIEEAAPGAFRGWRAMGGLAHHSIRGTPTVWTQRPAILACTKP
jgi:hypothetical protein